MSHFPLTGSIGLDLYIDEGNGFEYFRTFVPPFNCENGYKSEFSLRDNKTKKKARKALAKYTKLIPILNSFTIKKILDKTILILIAIGFVINWTAKIW